MSDLFENIGKKRAIYFAKKSHFMAQKLALKFALWYNDCVNCFSGKRPQTTSLCSG